MKPWSLDRWDYILFGIWCALVIGWGIWTAGWPSAPIQLIKFDAYEAGGTI